MPARAFMFLESGFWGVNPPPGPRFWPSGEGFPPPRQNMKGKSPVFKVLFAYPPRSHSQFWPVLQGGYANFTRKLPFEQVQFEKWERRDGTSHEVKKISANSTNLRMFSVMRSMCEPDDFIIKSPRRAALSKPNSCSRTHAAKLGKQC